MYQILEELNKTSGITGSMVVGNDGIVIAADLNTQIEEELCELSAVQLAAK